MDTAICPSLGTLRAHLDHDDPATTEHLDGCDACRDTILTVAETAGTARRLLALLDAPALAGSPSPIEVQDPDRSVGVDADTGGRRTRPAPVDPRRTAPTGRRDRRSRSARRPGRRVRPRIPLIAAAAAVAVAAATVGHPVVALVLDQFRARQVAAVVVDPGGLDDRLAALEAIAEVDDVVGETLRGDGGDLTAAAALARVDEPDAAVLGDASGFDVRATSAVGVRVTFRSSDEVPERLRGVVVQAIAPGTLVVRSDDLVVVRSRGIEVTATGAPLEVVRDTLLAEVELPADLRDQLAAIDDWRDTLPVPVPADTSLWDRIDVDGAGGLAIGQGEAFGVVVWQRGEVLHAIAGERAVEELLILARRL